LLALPGQDNTWKKLVTLDNVARHKPDVLWDLNRRPLPFKADTFEELHFYEVLEHIGTLGDAKGLFEEFHEYWRILEPGGHLFATVPDYRSVWAFGDPSHVRVINDGTLVFFSQEEYKKQVGVTPMSDFRDIWHGDFDITSARYEAEGFKFVLTAVKPSRK
jgi:hypothetical protein